MQTVNKFGKVVDVSVVKIRKVNGMSTPCVDVCSMDTTSGFCKGCARTKNEIGCWSSISEEERQRVIDELPDRKQYINLPKLN